MSLDEYSWITRWHDLNVHDNILRGSHGSSLDSQPDNKDELMPRVVRKGTALKAPEMMFKAGTSNLRRKGRV